jgi:hypothetical protein
MMGRPHRCNHAAPTASGRFFHWQPAAVNGAQSSDSGCSAIACWISRILGADVSSPQLDASSWAQLCSIMPQFLSKLYQGNHLPAQDTVSYPRPTNCNVAPKQDGLCFPSYMYTGYANCSLSIAIVNAIRRWAEPHQVNNPYLYRVPGSAKLQHSQ